MGAVDFSNFTPANPGVDNVFQSEAIKNKIKNNLKELYDVEYNSEREDVKLSIKKSHIDNYLEKNNNDMCFNYEKNIYSMKCDCGKNHYFDIKPSDIHNRKKYKTILCTICNPNNHGSSGLEIQLQNFIKENYNEEIILNSRNIIKPYELDIYLPKINLAFEFNGTYWHNSENKPKDYHLIKYNMCKEKDIQLIQIWEDEWLNNQDIIKSIIIEKLNLNNSLYLGFFVEEEKEIYFLFDKNYGQFDCDLKFVNDLEPVLINDSYNSGYSKYQIVI